MMKIDSITKASGLSETEKLDSVKQYELQDLLSLLGAYETNTMEFSDAIVSECLHQLGKHNIAYL